MGDDVGPSGDLHLADPPGWALGRHIDPADWTALRDLLKPLLDMNEEIHPRLLRRRAAARTVRGEGDGAAAAVPPPEPAPGPQGTQEPGVAAKAEPSTTGTPDTTVTPNDEPEPSAT